MTDILCVDSVMRSKSLVSITGKGVMLSEIEIPISLNAGYQGREFDMTEVQDRTKENNSGILVLYFSINNNPREGDINGLRLYALREGSNNLRYMAAGMKMPPVIRISQEGNPLYDLKGVEIRVTEEAET